MGRDFLQRAIIFGMIALPWQAAGQGQETNPETVIREAKAVVDETTKNIASIKLLFATPTLSDLISEGKFISDLREQRAVSSRLFAKIRSIISRCDIAITQVKVNVNQLHQQVSSTDGLSDEDKNQASSRAAKDYFTQVHASATSSLNEALALQKDAQAKIEDLRKTSVDVEGERTKWDEAVRVLTGVRAITPEAREAAQKALASLNQNLRTHLDNLRRAERRISSERQDQQMYQKIVNLYKSIDTQTQSLITLTELVSSLQNGQGDLESEINRIDERFVSKINDTRTRDYFTAATTAIFGLAVIIVIIFFFRLADNDTARVALFQNDSGLQFVTLFSIVIAIILFGVLKILEGRELAALLGGLSGYILGRGSISKQPGQDQPATGVQSTQTTTGQTATTT